MADQRRPTDAAASPDLSAWRALVDRALQGRDFSTLQSRTHDGIVIEPLYGPRADRPSLPGRGGKPWAIYQTVDDTDPERANAQALDDIDGGADGLALRFAGAASAAGLGLPATDEALALALDTVDLAAVRLRVDPHPHAMETAGWVRALVARQGVAPELTDIGWGLDPLVLEAPGGGASGRLAAAFRELHAAGFRRGLAEIDARPIHEAGGSEAQELAVILAGSAWWLRALDAAGVPAETALPCFGATVVVDRDQFVSIAKLRALRFLWARLVELCGVAPTPLHVHAETSRRMMTRADPHTNLLRTAIAGFAAGVGGADSVTVLPYTAALGLADRAARALARNAQHLLMKESHLHRVADPAAGSGLVEALTDGLCEAAWREFQAIETEGGLIESLRNGALRSRIALAREALREAVGSGGTPLVGATVFRPTGPAVPTHEAVPGSAHIGGLEPVSLEALAEAGAA